MPKEQQIISSIFFRKSKIMPDALKILHSVPGSSAACCKTQTFHQNNHENRDWEMTTEYEINHEISY
jgi:hypothetical protein